MSNIKYAFLLVAAAILGHACITDELYQDVPLNEPYNEEWGLGDSVPIVSSFYFTGKVDSMRMTLQDSIQNVVQTWDSIKYGPCGDSNIIFGQVIRLGDTVTNRNVLEIRFLNCLRYDASADDQKAMLAVGAYPFGSSSLADPRPGVEIRWTDSEGTLWKSYPGTGQVENNVFRVLKIDPDSDAEFVITGVMDVNLYNGINSAPIEAGEFNLRIGAY